MQKKMFREMIFFSPFVYLQVPRHKSEGQKNRLRRLAYQLPLSDISWNKCRFLDPKHREDFDEYSQKVQSTILRVGNIRVSNR